MPFVSQRWLGGMLTNWITLKSRIERLKNLEKEEAAQLFNLFHVHCRAVRTRSRLLLFSQLSTITNLVTLKFFCFHVGAAASITKSQERRRKEKGGKIR